MEAAEVVEGGYKAVTALKVAQGVTETRAELGGDRRDGDERSTLSSFLSAETRAWAREPFVARLAEVMELGEQYERQVREEDALDILRCLRLNFGGHVRKIVEPKHQIEYQKMFWLSLFTLSDAAYAENAVNMAYHNADGDHRKAFRELITHWRDTSHSNYNRRSTVVAAMEENDMSLCHYCSGLQKRFPGYSCQKLASTFKQFYPTKRERGKALRTLEEHRDDRAINDFCEYMVEQKERRDWCWQVA